MESQGFRIFTKMLILACRIVIVSLLATTLADALRIPFRSVEKCADHAVGYPELTVKESTCYRYCENTHFLKDKKARESNRQVADARITNKDASTGEGSQCCCRFNSSWPDYVKPEAADVHVRTYTTASAHQCLTLVMQVKLSKRTRDSYHLLCKYLTKPGPFTMLEVLKLAEAAAYLNFVRPKHPFILSVLNIKDVGVLNFKVAKDLADVISNQLLDSSKQLDDYDGQKLGFETMDAFGAIRKFRANETLKSRLVAEAFDEYVVSYALVDLLAASEQVKKVNKQSLKLPENIIRGEYDSYHVDGLAIYFRVKNLDCKLLKKVTNRLRNYLAHVKMTLSVLYEKLVYEHVAMKYKPLAELIEVEKVYKSLWKVNCAD